MVKVRNANNILLATYTYGASNQRLVSQAGDEQSSYRTYYAWGGDAVVAEYSESPSQPTSPQWTKSYVYLGARLLATLTPTGTSSELIQYHHPDRLGTRLVTNASDTNSFEQVTLPFGTALDAESSGATNRRFTSYDRSSITGLDYAVNRHYDSQQGRFTQVDPIGAGASSLDDPQSLNLYAYCANDPVNRVDPSGLFWGKLFKWIGKALKWIAIAAAVATMVLTVFAAPLAGTVLGQILGFIAGIPNAIGGFIAGVGKTIAGVFTFVESGVSAGVAGLIGNGVLLGGSAAIGAISRNPQGGKTIRRQQKEARRLERERQRRVRVRIPGNDPIDPNPKPPTNTIPETRTPSPPDPRPINPDEPRLPENATRGQKFRFAISEALNILAQYFGRGSIGTIMIDPAAIAEEACKEDPSSDLCRQFIIFIPPHKRCQFVPCF